MKSESNPPIGMCVRCGDCCRSGGPALHREDRELIESGVIHSRFLCTIREGEPARDNVNRGLQFVDSDIIKIKGESGSWRCVFFDDSSSACRIYDSRPLECRAMKCWDTRRIKSLYAKNRLTRRDLLASIEGLWSLVEGHQQRCSIDRVRGLITKMNSLEADAARKELAAIVRYDEEIRTLVVDRGGLAPDMLEFVFGRSLVKIIETLGIRIRHSGKARGRNSDHTAAISSCRMTSDRCDSDK
jgi:Fe-S-cluster containining protein